MEPSGLDDTHTPHTLHTHPTHSKLVHFTQTKALSQLEIDQNAFLVLQSTAQAFYMFSNKKIDHSERFTKYLKYKPLKFESKIFKFIWKYMCDFSCKCKSNKHKLKIACMEIFRKNGWILTTV